MYTIELVVRKVLHDLASSLLSTVMSTVQYILGSLLTRNAVEGATTENQQETFLVFHTATDLIYHSANHRQVLDPLGTLGIETRVFAYREIARIV